jgi:gamma-glutamylcyclotransferase (GGCT)/AIG2-like uncharacterized protein YtfP
MTTMRLFMIGSWTEGMMHFSKLAPYVVSYETAHIEATVYKLPIGFPVLVSDKTQVIQGQLLELQFDETLLAVIDTLHGVHPLDAAKGLHIRSKAQIRKISGDIETADVYFFNPKKLTSKAEVITDAAWKKMLDENPPLPETLSERQKSYVLKLGAVKGRDIVPIQDLTLYRELMKLELIVDKGRRLALSSLGKEVYKHLQ